MKGTLDSTKYPNWGEKYLYTALCVVYECACVYSCICEITILWWIHPYYQCYPDLVQFQLALVLPESSLVVSVVSHMAE